LASAPWHFRLSIDLEKAAHGKCFEWVKGLTKLPAFRYVERNKPQELTEPVSYVTQPQEPTLTSNEVFSNSSSRLASYLLTTLARYL